MDNIAEPALRARDLAVWRGDQQLCAGFKLELRRGELLEVTGVNGCGKSTLLRVLAGLLVPDAGEVSWQGEPIHEAGYTYWAAMAYLGHRDAVTAALTARDNLAFAAALGAGTGDVSAALERMGLAQRAATLGGSLSAGESRRLALARLLVRPARLWLLDEPLANLDGTGREACMAMVAEHLGAAGIAVVTGHRPAGWPVAARHFELRRH